MSKKTAGRKGEGVSRKAGMQGGTGGKRAGQDGGEPRDPFDRWLEDKLRNAYSSVLEEPIPEELLKLLHKSLKD